MKLRNKKTGEIIDRSFIIFRDISPNARIEEPFASISQLNENWEDYKPAEPLIKDDKVRKAVRAWAVAESEDCYYGIDDTTLKNGSGDHIEFWSRPFKDLTPYEHYTITELCGEEEE